MSKYWLKMIGTTHDHCPDSWKQDHVHFRKRRPRSIHPGDRVVLYAVGGQQRVFALAEFTSKVYENGDREWPYQMDVSYSTNLPVSSGVHIDEVSTPDRNLKRSLTQKSYIELTQEEYQRAEAKIRAKWKERQETSCLNHLLPPF